MAQGNANPTQGRDPSVAILVLMCAGIGAGLIFWAGVSAGDFLAGQDPQNPLDLITALRRGEHTIHPASWVVMALLGAGVLAALIAAVVAVRRRKNGRSGEARSMGNSGKMGNLSDQSARKIAKDTRKNYSRREAFGILLGETADSSRKDLWLGWESNAVVIAGSGMRKTTAYVIPAIMEAPGPVLATTNKPDVYRDTAGGDLDGTLVGRAAVGNVWLFDPQGINSDGQATFWWDALAGINNISLAEEHVVGLLVDGCPSISQSAAGNDAYFQGGAKRLLAALCLAAALEGGDLYHVKDWVSDDANETPVEILRRGGAEYVARDLYQAIHLNPRQKDGLWDMARSIMAVLNNPAYGQWVTPPVRRVIDSSAPRAQVAPSHRLPQFFPEQFPTSTDTMYALSKEGEGAASGLLTLLVGQIMLRAEAEANKQISGRLDPPMVTALDEAANICPLNKLPDWYSHHRSRGSILLSFFQSPSQGESTFGRERFKTLCDAAILGIYGGNVDDFSYLDSLSKAIGKHWITVGSQSHSVGLGSSGGGSLSNSQQQVPIVEVDSLKALDPGEAIISAPGTRPILARKCSWMDRPYARDIEAAREVYARARAVGGGYGQVHMEATTASGWGEYSV